MLLQAKPNKYRYLLLALLSSVLLWLGWPPITLNFILFLGLVPLLAMEDRLAAEVPGRSFPLVVLSFVSFMVWNGLTTWWISYATVPGALMAIVLNSLLMTLPIFLFHKVKRHAGRLFGYIALVCFWLSFEYTHLNWDAPWPWLNLGNGFASSRDWIQWYEYTGTMGGTLWVWVVNILIYETLAAAWPRRFPRLEETRGKASILGAIAGLCIIIPIVISILIKPANQPLRSDGNIVVVQPNIDPYYEKFDESTFSTQINTLISLSEQGMDSNTRLIAWPETAIAESINEQNLLTYPSITQIKAFLSRHPKVKLIAGINSYTIYNLESQRTPTARPFPNSRAYLDIFNSAVLLDTSAAYEIYHKSKLVPGVEKMPYPRFLGFLEKFAIDLGGSSGSLGSQDSSMVFNIGNGVVAAPIICYESIFGEYVSSFVRKGANVITIITNDGWWENTPGYRQHLEYGALRAIETRRFVARSANTGVSAFILPSGDIISETGFWTPAVLKSRYVLNNQLTFYVRHGDFIAKIALFVSIIMFLIAIFGGVVKKLRG